MKKRLFLFIIMLVFIMNVTGMCKELKFKEGFVVESGYLIKYAQIVNENIYIESTTYNGYAVYRIEGNGHIKIIDTNEFIEPNLDKIGFPFAVKDDIVYVADIYHNQVIKKDTSIQKVISGNFGWNNGKESAYVLKDLTSSNVIKIAQNHLWIYSIKEKKLLKCDLDGKIVDEFVLPNKICEEHLEEFEILNNDNILWMTPLALYRVNLQNAEYEKIYQGFLCSIALTENLEILVLEAKGKVNNEHRILNLIDEEGKIQTLVKLQEIGYSKVVSEKNKVLLINLIGRKIELYTMS